MKINRLFSIAAATLMMVACSSEDTALKNTPAAGPQMQFTATIAAPNSGATTRTEYTEVTTGEAAGTINVAWKENDKIALIHNGVKDVVTVTAVDNTTGKATIKGYITGSPANNDNVALVYPAALVSEATGDGTNYTEDNTVKGKMLTQSGIRDYIQDNLDFRKGSGKLSVSGTEVTLADPAPKLNSAIAIWKLTLQDDAATPAALSATQVKIKGGESVLASTTTLTAGTSVVTLAIPTDVIIDGALTIEATVGSDTYAYTKTGVSFNPGKYYQSTVTMKKAGWAANEYNEASWDNTNSKVVYTKKSATRCGAVSSQTGSMIIWDSAWLTVSGNVTLTGNVQLTQDVHLILQDGATLTINGQLICNEKNLNIYGQDKGDGKLNVSFSDNMNGTAIDGGMYTLLEIHGGEITAAATGNTGMGLEIDHFKMYGGKLTSTSKNNPGIVFTRDFEVYGGEVVGTTNSTSGPSNGIYGINGVLTVYGGKVTATGNGINDTEYDDYGSGFGCKVQSGTTGIKFYFSDNGTDWDAGTVYGTATASPTNRYAKAE